MNSATAGIEAPLFRPAGVNDTVRFVAHLAVYAQVLDREDLSDALCTAVRPCLTDQRMLDVTRALVCIGRKEFARAQTLLAEQVLAEEPNHEAGNTAYGLLLKSQGRPDWREPLERVLAVASSASSRQLARRALES